MYKSDFPIFQNNPGLVYLDNGASSQKPKYVIDGVSDFVSNDYANIHRGNYKLSERAEEQYEYSKELVAKFINANPEEIIYTYNANYAFNMIAQSLAFSGFLKKGDSVLLGIREHHSNIVTRQMLAEKFHFEVRFVNILEDYGIDYKDFAKKYDETVKVVSLGQVSNVTGKIYDIAKIKAKLNPETFFIVDGSQSIPHMEIDVQNLGCDCFIFTGHKMLAYTGIGTMYLNKKRIKTLSSTISGGGAIEDVSIDGYSLPSNLMKFEAGTPNIIGAVSLTKAIEYIQNIGGISAVKEQEDVLIDYALKRFAKLEGKVNLIGPKTANDRVGVFSFTINGFSNQNKIGEIFSEKNVCIRCGGHCAYPLHKFLKIGGTCRMSTYLYNDLSDLETFFDTLEEIKYTEPPIK